MTYEAILWSEKNDVSIIEQVSDEITKAANIQM